MNALMLYNECMKTLTVRNLPRQLAEALNRERRRSDRSLNQTVIDVLSRGLGIGDEGPRRNGAGVETPRDDSTQRGVGAGSAGPFRVTRETRVESEGV